MENKTQSSHLAAEEYVLQAYEEIKMQYAYFTQALNVGFELKQKFPEKYQCKRASVKNDLVSSPRSVYLGPNCRHDNRRKLVQFQANVLLSDSPVENYSGD